MDSSRVDETYWVQIIDLARGGKLSFGRRIRTTGLDRAHAAARSAKKLSAGVAVLRICTAYKSSEILEIEVLTTFGSVPIEMRDRMCDLRLPLRPHSPRWPL